MLNCKLFTGVQNIIMLHLTRILHPQKLDLLVGQKESMRGIRMKKIVRWRMRKKKLKMMENVMKLKMRYSP